METRPFDLDSLAIDLRAVLLALGQESGSLRVLESQCISRREQVERARRIASEALHSIDQERRAKR